MQKKKEQAREELYGELGHAFNFTYGDLESNRAGFLTHRQAKIRRNIAIQLSLFLIGAACFVLILYALLYYARPNDAQVFKFFVLATAAVPIGLLAVALLNWYIVSREIQKRLIRSKICTKTTFQTQNATSHSLAEKSGASLGFAISEAQFNALQGKDYRVYYLPNGGILSVEEGLPE
jgi:hypothetical protein